MGFSRREQDEEKRKNQEDNSIVGPESKQSGVE